jgi:hypothetical protein
VSRIYTPEEDELIKATSLDELQGLANFLGRKRHNILNRRTRLLRGDDLRAEYRRPPPVPIPARPTRDVLAGRPAWFDDIGVLHTRLRSGR